jgi:hypothetical protein
MCTHDMILPSLFNLCRYLADEIMRRVNKHRILNLLLHSPQKVARIITIFADIIDYHRLSKLN